MSQSREHDYKLYLPTADTQSEISIAVQAIPSVLGRNLHDFFEKKLRVLFGDQWVMQLKPENENERLNPRDFALLQKSWLFYRNSPLRTYLPIRNPDFEDLSHRCLKHRNALAHNHGDFKAQSMLAVVQDFKKFAEKLELEISSSLAYLEKRMADLANNRKWHKSDSSMSLAEAKKIFEAELKAKLAIEAEIYAKNINALKEENALKERLLEANQEQQEILNLEIAEAKKKQEALAFEIEELHAQLAAMALIESTVIGVTGTSVAQPNQSGAVRLWAPSLASKDLIQIGEGSFFSSIHPSEQAAVDSILELGRLVDQVSEDSNGGLLSRIKGNQVFLAALKSSHEQIFGSHQHGELESPIGVQLPVLLTKSRSGTLVGLVTNRLAAIKRVHSRFIRSDRFMATNQGCLLGPVDGQWCCVGEYEIGQD